MTRLGDQLEAAAAESIGDCPACGARDHSLLISQRAGRHLDLATVYQIYQCRVCGLAHVSNTPSAEVLAAVYDRHFFSTSQQGVPVDAEGRWTPESRHSPVYRNACRRLRDLRRYQPSGELLDIGCGRGYFLKVAAAHFQVVGNDLSADAVDYGRGVLGLEMIAGDFIRAAIPAGKFDVITMWDALASLGDPAAAVAEVSRLLRPTGLFVFTIPDIASAAFRLTGRFWPLLIPPINLFYFTRRSVQALLSRFDLRLVAYRRQGKFVDTNFVLRKLGRILGLSFLDREDVRIPGLPTVYLNLGDIATVYASRIQ